MKRRPGHAAGLSAGLLAREALNLVDSEGTGALSIRGLARQVGVEPMSIYNYFPNKDALLEAVWDQVLVESTVTEKIEDWQDYASTYASTMRTTLLRHPNMLPLMLGRPARTLTALDAVETAVSHLVRGGLPVTDAVDLFNTLTTFTVAHTLNEYAIPATAPTLNEQRHPTLATLGQAPGSVMKTDVERFTRALTALIEGYSNTLKHLNAES